jgi:hypothetical protein
MYRIPLPLPDTILLLSSRFVDVSDPIQIVVGILVCLLLLGLVIWLYRWELRLVHRAAALGLLLCRLIVLGLLLFVVGFQPVVARSATEHLPSRVLIAVDRSQSMEIADPQRPRADKLELARAFNLAGDPEQVCQQVDQWTRTEIARRVLSEDGLGLLHALGARHQVELIGFAREAWQADPERPDTLFQNPESQPGGDATKVSPSLNSSFTDLRLPLARSLEAAHAEESRVLGVLLLTDGQHNWGPSPVAPAQRLGGQGIPVYPIAIGAKQAPADIALVGVKAPSAVFKDADAPVEARLKVSGLPAQDVVVQLQRPDQAPLEQRFHHDGTDRYYTVSFQVRLDKTGTQSVLVSVKPAPGERWTENNNRPFAIQVADDTARILLVDGEARWEYHYLANALLRDRTVQLQKVLFAQPRLGVLPEAALEKSGNPLLRFPSEPDALAVYDCIILGDVSPAELPLDERNRLEKYVADRGGTLVITAGKRFMPLGYVRGAPSGKDTEDPFLKLLPIEEPKAVESRRGFALALAQEGRLSPFLQMEPGAEKNESRWAQLPRHYWGVIGRCKPGATPLAYVREDGKEPTPKELESLEKERALITRQNYGFGRVLFIGLESTWRWRYKVGDQYHHRFWGQVIRWAASDKPLVAGNKYVRFGTREAIYHQGQEVELQVRLGDEAIQLRSETPAGARILRQANGRAGTPWESVALVPLKPRERQPRVLEGRIGDLPAGQYAIELAIPELADKLQASIGPDGQSSPLRATFTVLPPESEEMVELATNWPLLEELAAKSGGKVFTPENARDLVEIFARNEVTREHYSERRLWEWWPTLALVLFFLTAEWVVRKWAGLP